MSTSNSLRRAIHCALLTGAAAAVALPVYAQDDSIQEVVVTGTRITVPNAVSSSPVYSVGADEIELQQQPEIEKILRVLPITRAEDGQNANNGSEGAATIDLRGLGSQRNLILINGKRVTPYNFDGLVDTSIIPTALIERIDIVTGGASAVYGSDAVAGAINFVLKRDFEGVEVNTDFSQYEEGDGDIRTASITLGSNVADGRGNVVLSMNWTDREGVQLGARPLGNLGIVTETGGGLDNFLSGQLPTAAPAGCQGPGAVATDQGGSGTTLPTGIDIAGSTSLGQFRDDGSIGDPCSVFNFNPFNYYQTPQQRYGGKVMGRFEISEHAETYARFAYSSTNVTQQVAPSGIFGDNFWTPLANPFITDQARGVIIAGASAGLADGTLIEERNPDPDLFKNWRDLNNNGVIDTADDLNLSYFRRTVEFGPRSTSYDNNAFQLLVGTTGQIIGDWEYDVSFQYGESDRTNTSAGYSNVANAANAVDSIDGVTCRTGGPSCVPLNLFGGFGAITPEMAAYSSATAIEQQAYEQTIVSASVTGPIDVIQIPWASSPLAVSLGAEYREEFGRTVPDECWKLAPTSCLGGAGGNLLPVAGGFDVRELFGEALLPLLNDAPGAQSLALELGYRYSDYDPTGVNRTYKYGLSWRPMDQLLVRAMKQRAARAPNVGELAAPNVADLDSAVLDPCSIANAGNITPELQALCTSTGMSAPQVGTVLDIISGQINTFTGTDLDNLPKPEEADTLTLGFVWTPDFIPAIRNPVISVDYYDIDIKDVIGEFAAQEVLDGCYVAGDPGECAKIIRVGGNLVLPGSGVETFTTNLDYLQAEGIELGFSFGIEIGRFGSLSFSGNVNKYLTQESQSSLTTPVLECVGHYGTACLGPLPDVRWIQRTTWGYGDFAVSALWRHVGSVSIEEVQRANTFDQFESIDSYDYIDLYASWDAFDMATLSLGILNVFEEDPPIVGNEAADVRSNSGNTFPSTYDTLGRMFSVGLNVRF